MDGGHGPPKDPRPPDLPRPRACQERMPWRIALDADPEQRGGRIDQCEIKPERIVGIVGPHRLVTQPKRNAATDSAKPSGPSTIEPTRARFSNVQ